MEEEIAYLFKIIVIGDAGVGKSNIITKYTRNVFDETMKPTLGVEFIMKKISVKEKAVKLQIWDTAGQEKYRALAKNMYRNAVGVLIVYDVSKRKSFDSVRKWIEEARQYTSEGSSVIIVGNKKDLVELREVSVEEAQTMSQEQKCYFLETSALDNSDKMIERVFSTIAEDILSKKEETTEQMKGGTRIEINNTVKKEGQDEKKDGKCC